MPATAAFDRPSRLGSIGRYGAVFLVTIAAWLVTLPQELDAVPDDVAPFIILDLGIGIAVMALLPLRRRFPLAVAATIAVVGVLSSAAFGSWILAAVSLGTRRRAWQAAVAGLVSIVTTLVSNVWNPVSLYIERVESAAPMSWWSLALFALLVNTLVMAVGFYLGARRDLLRSLRERAETAEREQASRAAQARSAERARIAREMHDALGHRISTVAMHSGALAYRDDLTAEQVHDTAQLIQENAHGALVELRDILGVLRDDAGGGPPAEEPPQPTIADLPMLVEEADAAGQDVNLALGVTPESVPTTLGRHVYRVVQECLTNARKHAPGTPVEVQVTRVRPWLGRGDLVVEVSNPLTREAGVGGGAASGRRHDLFSALPPGDRQEASVPSSGVGLLGLAERADLAGGRLEHGPENGRYVTRFTVPWPERSDS